MMAINPGGFPIAGNRYCTTEHRQKLGVEDVSKWLTTLPPQEKKALLEKVKESFGHGETLFTLFGSKPITWEIQPSSLAIVDQLKKAGFDMSRYIVTTVGYDAQHPDGNVVIINKAKVLETLQDPNNCKLFNKVFPDLTPFEFVRKLEVQPELFDQFWAKADDLSGVLLGYGRENAVAWNKGCPTKPMQSIWETPAYQQLLKDDPTFRNVHEHSAGKGFRSVEAMLEAINNGTFQTIKDAYKAACENYIDPPSFRVVLDAPETKQLTERYAREWRQIMKIFRAPDFAEQVLRTLVKRL